MEDYAKHVVAVKQLISQLEEELNNKAYMMAEDTVLDMMKELRNIRTIISKQ